MTVTCEKTEYQLTVGAEGYESCDLVVEIRGDKSWRTVLVRKQELPLPPWRLVNLLNDAYRRGRAEMAEDMRELMGVKQR